ncbi:MAG: Asp-tRNA(Asn)/Glu-tRNA(Gln) amidotransferase subunit GatA [Phycisphaerales bacterium]|nr:MAG: Asp-tRNA(Asn)/Glu-tRNA(Gln) amidotransferase subunit GatA [Phycisphaerales bacterium]
MSGAFEIASGVRTGAVRAQDAAADALRRAREDIDAGEDGLHAVLQMFEDRAMASAEAIDARVARGEDPGPLAGVPVLVKDNICTGFGRTTCGSRFLERYESPFSATCVERLESAGAVVIGKTNLDEFGMGSSGEHSAFGPTRHPLDRERVPGGSSSGSAAAVGAGIAPVALGSDTGGSVRQPASFCGLVGLKPTYGRVSRWGLVAFASSLDQVGVLSASVRDAALTLSSIAGHDPRDSTSSAHPSEDFTRELAQTLDGIRVGVPKLASASQNHPSVHDAIERTKTALQARGVQIVPIELPSLEQAVPAYYVIAPAEASSNLARFDGVRYGRRAALQPGEGLDVLYKRSRTEGFGEEVRRRIMLGTHVLSSGYYDAYYETAMRVRRVIAREFTGVCAENGVCDAVLMPTTPGPAFRLGEKTTDPLALWLEDVYTTPANLAGLPAISVPAGFTEGTDTGGVRLPIGVQLIGRAFDEARLCRIAHAIEVSAQS